MKKLFISLFLMLVIAQGAAAQDPIAQIRKDYTETKRGIDEMMQQDGWPPCYYELTIVENLPGTGPHRENIHIFYDDVPYEGPEEEEGDYALHPYHWMQMVTAKYNFAAREFYEEYFFDREGHIRFIYARWAPSIDDDEHEFRLYYDQGQLIRFMVGTRAVGSQGKFKQEYAGKTCPEDYSWLRESFEERCQKWKRLFEAVEASVYY